MKIVCDIDGVLADFNTPYIDLIRELTGKTLPRPSATYPDTWNYHYDDKLGPNKLTPSEAGRVWDHIKNSNFWVHLPPMDQTLRTLEKLRVMRLQGHEIYFLTSRPGADAKLFTEIWLKGYGMANPTVLIAPSDYSKGQICKALQADIFIDDKPNNCAEVALATVKVGTRIFLVDAPYNRIIEPELSTIIRDVVIRVDNALQALERIGMPSEQAA